MAGRPARKNAAKDGMAGVGLAAIMVVCCATIPLLAALAGSVALGTVLGVGAGAVGALMLGSLVVAWARRRRTCDGRQASPE